MGENSKILLALKLLISSISAMWVSFDLDIRLLVVLSSVDFATGLANSRTGLAAICRRMALKFILVGTVHYVYGLCRAQGLNVGFDIGSVACTFYILGSAINILKNCSAAGLQLPPALLDMLSKAEGLTGADQREIDALKLRQSQDMEALKVNQRDRAQEDRD